MKFGSREVGCWGGYWAVKFKFVFSHCESHSVSIFLLGANVVDNMAICDLGALGYFASLDEKISVSSLCVPWSLEKASNLS